MIQLIGRLLLPWLRFSVRPRDIAETLGNSGAPVCYVIARHSQLDALVLQRACAEAGLPRPRKQLLPAGKSRVQSLLAMTRKVGFWRTRLDRRPPQELSALLAELRRNPELDVLLVPVAVYWGRAPQREHLSWIRLLFSEDWALASNLRRGLAVLFNGRNAVVEFGAGVRVRTLVPEGMADNQATRRIARHLNGVLMASRTAYVGPDLSHRRTLMAEVLRGRSVRTLVAQEAADRGISRRQALLNAKGMFEEIAADYSHIFVRIAAKVLGWVLKRIYDDVVIGHAETIASVAAGNELIYVPCHRATMDDFLAPFAIYSHGNAVPHIAAGINLNLPVLGPMARKGGAFFMRRSFRGSALYSAIFMRYLGVIMARGHPIKYFIEGGRSRTGRSLAPKTGMLSMTVRSYLRQPVRPIMFVPVYIGYERIMEVDSYVAELSGKPKEKETLLGFLRSLKRLRENFGRAHVNFGEPIPLAPLLDAHQPSWRDKLGRDDRPAGVGPAVDALAQQIMRNIHSAAAVTPVNLLAVVMLATPRQVMREPDLASQLALFLHLLRARPYSDRVTITALDAAQIIEHGLRTGILVRVDEEMLGFTPRHATSMVYYRNNVLHLVAIPSLLACCFISNNELATADLQRLARRIYPYIAAELFLRWDESEVDALVVEQLRALAQAGLLREVQGGSAWRPAPAASIEAVGLSMLAQSTLQTIERYYLAIALLLRAGSGVVSQSELEKRCQEMAQRMLTLYGFHSPEFFDRTLFEGFLSLLRRRGVLRADAEGRLVFDEVLERIAADAQLVLSEQLRHSILQLVHG